MSSIIKLRWINLVGSGVFSLYGFLIGALPVGFMNLGIAIINVYYLIKIYKSKDDFKILPIDKNNPQYLNYFLEYYKSEINNFTDEINFDRTNYDVQFFILRNMVPTGLFLGTKNDPTTLEIELDFVIPEYRDFKIGNYIFNNMKDFFLDLGYTKFLSFSTKEKHINYLIKMGFEKTNEYDQPCYVKSIEKE
jgi:hypothetical protein